MDIIQEMLLEYNNKHTNKIEKSKINDDTERVFTLLDMQRFARLVLGDIFNDKYQNYGWTR